MVTLGAGFAGVRARLLARAIPGATGARGAALGGATLPEKPLIAALQARHKLSMGVWCHDEKIYHNPLTNARPVGICMVESYDHNNSRETPP